MCMKTGVLCGTEDWLERTVKLLELESQITLKSRLKMKRWNSESILRKTSIWYTLCISRQKYYLQSIRRAGGRRAAEIIKPADENFNLG